MPFREFTQTAVVNLHGCKVRTSYRVMVGMLVSLDCPKTGASAKGVCVRVWDPPKGVAGHEIAVQLIKPQNLWGVPDPPPDWEVVAKSMVQGRMPPGEKAAAPAPAAATSPAAPSPTPSATVAVIPPIAAQPVAAAPVVTVSPAVKLAAGGSVAPGGMGSGPASAAAANAVPVTPAAAPPVAPVAARLVPIRLPAAAASAEQRLADLERRATQLVDSVLDIMRTQAEELTRRSLEEFRQQIDAMLQDADARLHRTLHQTYEESATSLIGLRTDLMEQMATRCAQMIRSTEEALRNRLRTQTMAEERGAATKPPAPVTGK